MVKSYHSNPIRTFFLNLKPIVSYLLERLGEGNGNPLQYSCLEDPRDGVAQSWTRLKWLSSSRAVIGLPWWLSSEESPCQCKWPGFNPWIRKIPWRRKWQPTPVFLLGNSHRQRNLSGYSPWGCSESDAAKQQQSGNKSVLQNKTGKV